MVAIGGVAGFLPQVAARVAIDEAQVKEQAAATKIIADDAKADLDEARLSLPLAPGSFPAARAAEVVS